MEATTITESQRTHNAWMEIREKQTFYTGTHNNKHLVMYHDGIRTHNDGSPFYGMRIFNGKIKADSFVDALKSLGYQPRKF